MNRQTLSIAGRATSSLIQTQGVGDLYRIYSVCQRDGVNFNLANMLETFNVKLRYSFDPKYMQALFKVGYNLGRDGDPWAKVPAWFWWYNFGAAGGDRALTAKANPDTVLGWSNPRTCTDLRASRSRASLPTAIEAKFPWSKRPMVRLQQSNSAAQQANCRKLPIDALIT